MDTQLTEEQKAQVAGWVRDGAGLSDVQKRLADELGMSMTYMDVRFLIIDLNVELQEEPDRAEPVEPVEQADVDAAELMPPDEPQTAMPFDDAEPVAGGVSIEVDRLQKPGFLVSGTVRFSDGIDATWGLDQFGRLAIDAGQPDYKPSEADVQAFQVELQTLLAQKGF